ncbi:MAG: hypothetical protein CMP23_11250 [Rickettsiales bacterium]|nr:hypothetical protein [Rickettsiales bacterium]
MPAMYRLWLLVLLCSAIVQLAPPVLQGSQALACGGFFCSSITLAPIEQTAERVLFEVNSEGKLAGTVTVTVEISYTGSPDDFSWVLPVSDLVGGLEVVPRQALQVLDSVTSPQILPPPTRCTRPLLPPFFQDEAVAIRSSAEDGSPGVEVENLERVGPYEPQLVSSQDPRALIDWLNENDYLITAEMEPAVADYVSAGMKFLAMKLAPDAEVSDVAPISITYPGEEPMVPLVLTSVSAEPEMGVLVMIAAGEPYESANYANLRVPTEMVQAEPISGVNNYYPLLSWQIDEGGGEVMIMEFVGSSDDVSALAQGNWGWNEELFESITFIEDLAARQPLISRLYSRVSAWEINSDPSFVPSGAAALSRVHDLSDRPEVEVCAGSPRDVPCGSLYCGRGASCARTAEGEGCECPEGSLARLVTAPLLTGALTENTVICQDASYDLMNSLDAQNFAGGADPCGNFDCGSMGRCEVLGGFPTCRCDSGYAAVAVSGEQMLCLQTQESYGPAQLLWTEGSGCSCSASFSAARGSSGGLVLLSLAWFAGRRRWRRAAAPYRNRPIPKMK